MTRSGWRRDPGNRTPAPEPVVWNPSHSGVIRSNWNDTENSKVTKYSGTVNCGHHLPASFAGKTVASPQLPGSLPASHPPTGPSPTGQAGRTCLPGGLAAWRAASWGCLTDGLAGCLLPAWLAASGWLAACLAFQELEHCACQLPLFIKAYVGSGFARKLS